jgi:Concanavalin A-like lectin/glucanases superfamily/PEP-CTERM motif
MRISKSKLLGGACALALGMMTVQAGAALTHRYSFTTDATDSIGGANGTLVNTATVSGGQLQLNNPNFTAGTNPDTSGYLSLPPSILPTSGSVTIEQWFTFQGSGFFTEAYTFTNAPANGSPDPVTGQYLMHNISFPANLAVDGGSRIVETDSGTGAETNAFAAPGRADSGFLDNGGTYMATTVIDAAAGTLSYYLNGVLQSTVANPIALSSFNFTAAYLGRSAFIADDATSGSIDEFRIFNDAQSATDIAANFAAGPDDTSIAITVPEPASLSFLAIGALGLLTRKRAR